MSVDAIFSIEYFNFLGLVHSDENRNGVVDADEEGTFFNFIKQFDMNNNGRLDIDDTELYRISVGCTDSELKAAQEFEDFRNEYGSDVNKMTPEQKKIYDDIASRCANDEKTDKCTIFVDMIDKALRYFTNLPSQETKLKVFKEYRLSEINDNDYNAIMI